MNNNSFTSKRNQAYNNTTAKNSNFNYQKNEEFPHGKNQQNEKGFAKKADNDSFRTSSNEKIDANEYEKYKFKSLEKKMEKFNETDFNRKNKYNIEDTDNYDGLYEENRKLININTSLTLKNKNLECEIKKYEDKYKKIEGEAEFANDKLNDVENHYLKILKEKDENIFSLNKRISQLEKEDVKNINLRIALFKNLKLFFLNNLKYLKLSDETKKE